MVALGITMMAVLSPYFKSLKPSYIVFKMMDCKRQLQSTVN